MPNEIKIDLSKFTNFIKSTQSGEFVKVGILADGGKVNRNEGDVNNPTIGLENELGSITKNIPPRSFLRMPLEYKREEIMKDMASSKLVKKAIDNLSIITVLKLLGKVAEGKIQKAFESKGFGKWKENSPVTIAKKGSSAPLIDTSQLRDSVTSSVSK